MKELERRSWNGKARVEQLDGSITRKDSKFDRRRIWDIEA